MGQRQKKTLPWLWPRRTAVEDIAAGETPEREGGGGRRFRGGRGIAAEDIA